MPYRRVFIGTVRPDQLAYSFSVRRVEGELVTSPTLDVTTTTRGNVVQPIWMASTPGVEFGAVVADLPQPDNFLEYAIEPVADVKKG
jgi:hypothetical protein